MKTTLSHYDAMRMVKEFDRAGQFGHDGWPALLEYLERLEDDLGEEMEFDVIACCCDFIRFEDMTDYAEQYGSEGVGEDSHPGDLEHFACMIGDGPAFICHAH